MDSSTVRFKPRSIQLLSGSCRSQTTLAFPDIRFISSTRSHRLVSSLPGPGMLDLPRRCAFLTRPFRFFHSFSRQRRHLYRYRLLITSFFSPLSSFLFIITTTTDCGYLCKFFFSCIFICKMEPGQKFLLPINDDRNYCALWIFHMSFLCDVCILKLPINA